MREITVKRSAWFAGLILLLLFLQSGCTSGVNLGKVQVAIADISPVTSIMFPLTRPDEFDVALIRAVAARANLDLEIVRLSPEKILPGVTDCKYASGFIAEPVSDDLGQSLLFTDSYLVQGQVLVTKKGNIEITDRNKLIGATVGIQRGSPALDEIVQIPNVKTNTYDSLNAAFQSLITGYIDAVVTDASRATPFVNNKANGLKLVDKAFTSVNYAIAVCKTRADVQERLNSGLASVKADGTLANLINTYLK